MVLKFLGTGRGRVILGRPTEPCLGPKRGHHIENLEKDIPESQAPDLAKVICKKKLDFQV